MFFLLMTMIERVGFEEKKKKTRGELILSCVTWLDLLLVIKFLELNRLNRTRFCRFFGASFTIKTA